MNHPKEQRPTLQYGATCIYVDDVPAVLDFYREALGFETRFFDETLQYAELQTGDVLVAFASHELGRKLVGEGYQRPSGGRPAAVELAFFTDDVEAAWQRAVEAGAHPLNPPKKMEWGITLGFVQSIEGTVIGLATRPPDQAGDD